MRLAQVGQGVCSGFLGACSLLMGLGMIGVMFLISAIPIALAIVIAFFVLRGCA